MINPAYYGFVLAGAVLVGMVVLLEVGRRVALRHRSRAGESAIAGLGVIEGAVFSLLALLIAFTFAGAATRFDGRKQLVIQEANQIGAAYLRTDLLPEHVQPAVRAKFREYLDSRLETYRKLPDLDAAFAELANSKRIQGEIWAASAAGCRDSSVPACNILLLPALNLMFDTVTTRTETSKIHPPPIIFAMIVIFSFAAALLAGYGMGDSRSRSWIHIVGFAAVMALTVYVIVDIEYPRLGLISVAGADQVLVELRTSMQ